MVTFQMRTECEGAKTGNHKTCRESAERTCQSHPANLWQIKFLSILQYDFRNKAIHNVGDGLSFRKIILVVICKEA